MEGFSHAIDNVSSICMSCWYTLKPLISFKSQIVVSYEAVVSYGIM
jgi:hypothetical protein